MPPPRLAPRGRPLVVLALGVALAPAAAAAEPCVDNVFEVLTLAPPIVHEGERVVDAPPELAALDQLINSRDAGQGVIIREAATRRGAGLRIDGAFTPTPAVDARIDALERRTLDTACGTAAPFTPILPGHYAFVQPEGDRALVGAELLVAPGRDVVELRVRIGGRRLRAVYPITCARFDDEPAGACAPSEASPPDLDALRRHPPGAPPKRSPWEAKERRLKIQTRVSWSLVGVAVASAIPAIVVRATCVRVGCLDEFGSVVSLPFSAALFVGALIPAAIYTARLKKHRQRRPTSARVEPLWGGLGVRF